jgi:signal transduction histidine kinase
VEYSRPGLVSRLLLNDAANVAFLGGDRGARWLEVLPDVLMDIGIDALSWTTWNWVEREPSLPSDIIVLSNTGHNLWRFTFTQMRTMSPTCLMASAVQIDDVVARKQAADDTNRLYPELLNEIEELAEFGHYTYWPGERRGLWTDGIARIWTVPHASSHRDFETMVAAVHPQDLHPSAGSSDVSTVVKDSREVRIVRTDGEVRYIRSIGQRHIDADGRVERVVRLDKDVTELHHAEEELRLAREAASDASRAKDAFLHLMNHSLRTPLK